MNTSINKSYPQLDDNGDGKADTADGQLASTLYLNGVVSWGLKPVISEMVAPAILEEAASAQVAVKVTPGDVALERVWVKVISPDVDVAG